MAGMEEMLGSIMKNPQAMQQIFSLAQSLGLSQNQGQAASPSAQSQAPPAPAPIPVQSQAPSGQPDLDGMFRTILSLASQSCGNDRQTALFEALKPFLRPDRAKQLDRAMQVAHISQMASSAMKRLSAGASQGTGGNHV